MKYKESIEYDLHHSEYGKQVLRQYEILEEIYQSSLSHVFVIKDVSSQNKLILKVIRKQEFDFETDMIKKIDHKNIVKILDTGSSKQFLYIIREYVEGVNLEVYVEKHGPLSYQAISKMNTEISDAIHYLHSFKEGTLIFRDLKPSNIMMDDQGQVKLIDIITIRTVKNNQNTDTFYVGSKGYSAPEQYGYMQSDEKSDIYSLGATLYFLSTATHPEGQQFKKDISQIPSKRVQRVVKKATSFNPEKRHKSIDDFNKDLKRPVSKHFMFSLLMILVLGLSSYAMLDFMKNEPFEASNTEGNETSTFLFEISSGFEFELLDAETLHMTIDRKNMNSDIKDFEFVSISSSDQAFTKNEIIDDIDEGIHKYNIIAYSDSGLDHALGDYKNLYVVLYSKDKEALGYYIYNNIQLSHETREIETNVVHNLINEKGLSYSQIGDLTFTYENDRAFIHIDKSKVDDFSQISVYSFKREPYEEDLESVRKDIAKGINLWQYDDQGVETFYGYDGIRNHQTWYIVLVDNHNSIVKEYLFTDEYTLEDTVQVSESDLSEKKDIDLVTSVVHNLVNQKGLPYTQVGEDLTFTYEKDYAIVQVNQNMNDDFSKIAVYSFEEEPNEASLEEVRNVISEGNDLWDYYDAGVLTGYGSSGKRNNQTWFIALVNEELQVIKEYLFTDDHIENNDEQAEDIFQVVHGLRNEEGIEYSQVSETVSFHYYQPRALIKVDTEKEIDFSHMSVWSNPNKMTSETINAIIERAESGEGVRPYLPTGHDTGYGSEGIRNHQSWLILLLDDNYNVLKYYAFTDIFNLDDMGLEGLDTGVRVEYFEHYAVAYVDIGVYPEVKKVSFWGSKNGLSEATQEDMRRSVQSGEGIGNYNPETGYITGYGDTGSFKGQDWMLFLLNEDNLIIKEYKIINTY